jgi:hypothetical protein
MAQAEVIDGRGRGNLDSGAGGGRPIMFANGQLECWGLVGIRLGVITGIGWAGTVKVTASTVTSRYLEDTGLLVRQFRLGLERLNDIFLLFRLFFTFRV